MTSVKFLFTHTMWSNHICVVFQYAWLCNQKTLLVAGQSGHTTQSNEFVPTSSHKFPLKANHSWLLGKSVYFAVRQLLIRRECCVRSQPKNQGP
jgi:hypothetical protein